MKILVFMILIPLAPGFVIKSWKTVLKKCEKEQVGVPNLYIERIKGFSILKRCFAGSTFSMLACGCVIPVPIARKKTVIPETTTVLSDDVESSPMHDAEGYCPSYFRFVYDRTTVSDDKSIPSLRTDTIRFVRLPGSTGETSAFFGGNGIITVWTMSFITFASKFKFSIRFGMARSVRYEDQLYNLFGDGPCKEYEPRYSLLINPVTREIFARLKLRNRSNINLTLQNVVR